MLDVFDLIVGFSEETVAHVHTGVGYPRHVPLPATPHLVTFVTRQLTAMPRSLAEEAISVLRGVVAQEKRGSVPEMLATLAEGFGCRAVDSGYDSPFKPPAIYPRAFTGRVVVIPHEGWVGIMLRGEGFGLMSRKAAPFAYRSVGAMSAAALSHAAHDMLFADRLRAVASDVLAGTSASHLSDYRLPPYKDIAGRLGVEAVLSALEAIVGYWDAGMLTIKSQTTVNAAVRDLIDPYVERILAIEEPTAAETS